MMTRRETILVAVTAAFSRLGLTLPKWAGPKSREPWRAALLNGDHVPVTTVSGKVVMLPQFGEKEASPLMTWNVKVELDGKPCPCVYADEAAGMVVAYANGKFGSPVWEGREMVVKSGIVRITAFD